MDIPILEQIPIPPDFRGFHPAYCDQSLVTQGYRRNLPHWRYEGATYFITFRLNDSLPREAAADMRQESARWHQRIAAERLASGGKLTAATLKQWDEFQRRHLVKLEAIMDACHGACLLREPEVRALVEEALLHFDGARCRMEAFVIMPNHVHALCRPHANHALEDLAASWKKFSAARINLHLERTGQVWQRENFDRIIRDSAHYARAVRYIARNPVLARVPAGEATLWVNESIRSANNE